jgi:hypothetical protein
VWGRATEVTALLPPQPARISPVKAHKVQSVSRGWPTGPPPGLWEGGVDTELVVVSPGGEVGDVVVDSSELVDSARASDHVRNWVPGSSAPELDGFHEEKYRTGNEVEA